MLHLIPFAFFALPGLAQAAPIDLRSAVDQALNNSPVIRAAEEKVNEIRNNKYVARASLLPNIKAVGIASHQKDSVANKTVGSVAFGGNPYNLYDLTVTGEQPIFRWGAFSAVSSADYSREITMTELDIARRDLTRDVISVFYLTLMLENMIVILEEQEKMVGDILQTAQKRMNLGGKKIDVLQVRTTQALLKPQIERAKSDLAVASAKLADLLGQQESTSLTVRGRLVSLPVKEVEKNLNLKEFYIPELKKIQLQKEQVDANKSVALGKHLPDLKLAGTYAFQNYTKADLLDPASNAWKMQLVLTVPLFTGLSSIFERKALNSAAEQLEINEERISNDVRFQQISSRKNLEFAEASLSSAEEAAKLARQSLQEGQREYRFGIVDFLQFLQIQEKDFQAATSLMKIRLDAINAYATYFASSGQNMEVLVDLLARQEKKE